MTNSIFKSKEQYLAFRAAWASSVNNAKAKPTLKTTNEWITATDELSADIGVIRVPGNIKAEHHILYNILRGKPYDLGFTPITNYNKLANGAYINQGLFTAMIYLKLHLKLAADINANNYVAPRLGEEFGEFMEVFRNTVTLDMLTTIILPEEKPMHSNYGKTGCVAKQIMDGQFKPTRFSQIYAAIKKLLPEQFMD